MDPNETLKEAAERVGITVVLAARLVADDAVNAEPEELYAASPKGMEYLRALHKVEPGQVKERIGREE